jgi:3D (Asp-Asp-Asp) domain-containing protein
MVNGQLVSGATESSYLCKCAEVGGTCLTKTHASADTPSGFPSYVYGGTNSFSLPVQYGLICVSDVDLKITYVEGKVASFTATKPIIPASSALSSGCLQYRTDITGTLNEKGKPLAKFALKIKSDRNGTKRPDTLTQPPATNANGSATGRLVTRLRGVAAITDDNPDVTTPSPIKIGFADAAWETRFNMTGYIIASEADYGGAVVAKPCGLSGRYRRNFLYGSGVLMQGSGVDLKGNVITIDWARSKKPLNEANACFRVVSCATTASGTCATAGTTIAVDRGVVPKGAVVQIEKTGPRTAEDTGGAIKGYHIDVFRGFGKAAMKGWGNYSGAVSYVSGGAACN